MSAQVIAPPKKQEAAASNESLWDEITAIALAAFSLLLFLCLVTYAPDDPSWNAAGRAETGNLIGWFGANVAALLFQFFGLLAYLVPVFLAYVAWRFFRTATFSAPWPRVSGLVLLLWSTATWLDLPTLRAWLKPLMNWAFDGSFLPGGMVGAVLSRGLENGLHFIGATILLLTLAVVGFILATGLSFLEAIAQSKDFVTDLPGQSSAKLSRFRAWRARQRELAQARMEARRRVRAGQSQARREAAEADAIVKLHETDPPPARFAPLTEVADAPEIIIKRDRPAPPVEEDFADEGPSAEVVDMLSTATVLRKEADDETDANAEVAPEMAEIIQLPRRKPERREPENYAFPATDFLHDTPPPNEQADAELMEMAQHIAEKCAEFNVNGHIEHICPGPVVTTYEFKPAPGIKYSRVAGMVDDLCLALKAESVRIDRIPGKPHIGIEVPNPKRETIYLRSVIESRQFQEAASKLTIALGKTIDGINYVADLAKMPHLLVAGATGAGKSVGVNSLVVSILYKARPDEVKFIMVDPKRLELGVYEGIPHLATPIITEPKRATFALKWAVCEMERRYKEMAGWGVRNIDGYNMEVLRRNLVEDFDDFGEEWKSLPYIVIIVDELADLMMTSGKEVEESITRLAQMARAVGIHLVLATQRPSVDVITGLIKANFPSRVAYRVSSKVDSRTIIDGNGAEALLGRGDMLFLPPGTSRLVRVHGAFVDEKEIAKICEHVKRQWQPDYDESITLSEEESEHAELAGGDDDVMFPDALRVIVENRKASTSLLQRRCKIGYGRAAAILDSMERQGLIGPIDGAKPRQVLSRAYELVADWDEQGI
jgi:S-DNA-T family DNA segregation ATPase FtsK/SpoIIIE